jgi:hypothetical protein
VSQPENVIKHAIQILINIRVRESQNPPSAFREKRCTIPVVFDLIVGGVRGAVYLDSELRGQTCKIHDIRTDRILAPETQSIQGAAANARPQYCLGVGHAFSERSGARQRLAFEIAHADFPASYSLILGKKEALCMPPSSRGSAAIHFPRTGGRKRASA